MYDFIFSAVFIVLEMLCCFILFETFVQKRYDAGRSLLLMSILCVCIYITTFLLSEHVIVKQILSILEISLFIFGTFEIRWKQSLAFVTLYIGLVNVVDAATFLVLNMLFFNPWKMHDITALQHFLIILMGKMIVLLSVFLIRKYWGKTDINLLSNTEWICFLIMPIFTILAIITMISIFIEEVSEREMFFLFLIVAGMLGMNLLMFYLMKEVIQREKQLQEERISSLQAQCQMKEYEKQKQRAHEYKNQMMCIDTLLDRKRYVQAAAYVKRLHGEAQQTEDIVNTNQSMVDTIINMKYHEAIEKGILCVMQINDLSKISISDEDIVVLLSNLFHNAIEACEQCNGKKRIWLSIKQEKETITLKMENTFEKPLCYEGGIIKTTKKNTKEHGYGIKNIIRIVEKYHGEYKFGKEGENFTFVIKIQQRAT